jgi:hypothetical protein
VFYHLWNHPKLHFLLKPRKTADRVKVRDQENLHLALLLTSGHAEAKPPFGSVVNLRACRGPGPGWQSANREDV